MSIFLGIFFGHKLHLHSIGHQQKYLRTLKRHQYEFETSMKCLFKNFWAWHRRAFKASGTPAHHNLIFYTIHHYFWHDTCHTRHLMSDLCLELWRGWHCWTLSGPAPSPASHWCSCLSPSPPSSSWGSSASWHGGPLPLPPLPPHWQGGRGGPAPC